MLSSAVSFAYIDPVSGVILLQLFLGGCLAFFARFRHAIWRFGARLFSNQTVEATLENAAPLILRNTQPLSGENEVCANMVSLNGTLAEGIDFERAEDRQAA
jgi:hypothetical protein